MPFEWASCALGALLVALLAWLRSMVGRVQLQRRLSAWAAATKGAPLPVVPPVVPPVVAGLPVLGSALALGSGGADFLHRCREQHGDAFTLCLLGQRMTFVFAPAALQRYFTAPDTLLTFAPAVQQFTHRVFGLPPKHFYPRHIVMLQTLRHELIPAALPQHTARLLRLLLPRVQAWPVAGRMELVSELKGLVFEASVGALFGPRFLGQEAANGSSSGTGSRAGSGGAHANGTASSSSGGGRQLAATSRARRLQDAFFAFEGGFEMAASPLPHLLQPRFLAARRTLLAVLRESHRAGHFEGTVAGTLIEACGLPEQHVPNMLLALLWASQANAVPTIFWVLGLLLLPENRQHLEAVVAEARQAAGLGSAGAGSSAVGGTPAAAEHGTPAAAAKARARTRAQRQQQGELFKQQQGQQGDPTGQLLSEEQQRGLVELACNRHSRIAAAISETLRLRCFSIDVRIAASDGALPGGTDGSGPGIWVQKGDVVAISPYESHLDSRLYHDAPAAYNPSREGMHLGGSTAAHAAVVGVGGVPGLAFGGGKYRCPGRYFAEAELALIASLLLLLFDWRLLPREGAAERAAGQAPQQHKAGAAEAAAAGTASTAAAAGAAGASAIQAPPGDPASLLPPPDLRKLVGIKVPAEPCWVEYQRRQLAGS